MDGAPGRRQRISNSASQSGGSLAPQREFLFYTQVPWHIRLQVLGMGAVTISHPGGVSPQEQSNAPAPGAGDTHDGGEGSRRRKRTQLAMKSV